MGSVRPLWIALAVGVLAAAVFLPAVGGSWIYDDHQLIADNPYIQSFSWWHRWFTTDFWNVNEEIVTGGGRLIYWRPGISASYALDWALSGGSPLFFHIVNLLWQACVGAIAFVVLRRWIGDVRAAAVAAIFYSVHPTKAESVAWIAGRTDLICMTALLLAAEGIARRLQKRRGGIALEIGATILAYLTKEQAIVLPVFACVEAWVALDRPQIDRAAIVRMVKVAAPQAVVAVVYIALRAIFLPIEANTSSKGPPLLDHLLSVLETFGRFVSLTVAPLQSSIQQGVVHWKHGAPLHETPYVIAGGVAIAGLIGLAIAVRRRWPVATIGVGFYLVTLLPTSNLKYTEMRTLISERFLYVPIFGLVLILGAALARSGDAWRRRSYALATVVAIAYACLSLKRSSDFSDENSFWQREVELHPDSRIARDYIFRGAIHKKHFRTALVLLLEDKATFERYDQVDADDVALSFHVSFVLAHLTPDLDQATLTSIDSFCSDILDRSKPSASLSVGAVHISIARKAPSFERQLNPFRARLLALRADLNGRLDRDAEAIRLSNEASRLCDACVSVFTMNAIAHARAGNYEEASRILASVKGRVQRQAWSGVRQTIDKAKAAHDAAQGAEGPAQLQARALELATLELWGRAYAVLAPYKEEIRAAPRFVRGFAELAFRAGDMQTARDMLPPTEGESTLEGWALTMGWTE